MLRCVPADALSYIPCNDSVVINTFQQIVIYLYKYQYISHTRCLVALHLFAVLNGGESLNADASAITCLSKTVASNELCNTGCMHKSFVFLQLFRNSKVNSGLSSTHTGLHENNRC